MTLGELKQFLESYESLKAKIINFQLHTFHQQNASLPSLSHEATLSHHLNDFINQLSYCDSQIIHFSDFLNYSQRNGFYLDHSLNTEKTPMINFYRLWLKESADIHLTFMATAIDEISLSQLLFLDGRYESAEELLQFMQNNVKEGKSVYLNPNIHPLQPFTKASQSLLKTHPTCREFIQEHLAKQVRIAKAIIPDIFYDKLHHYLMALHEIGTQSVTWCFPLEKEETCRQLNEDFLKELSSYLSSEEIDSLEQKTITVPFRNSQERASAKLGKVLQGISPFDCVITQQIYLWAVLRTQKNKPIPENVLNCLQALPFDLNRIKPIYNDKHLEKSFSGLQGFFTKKHLSKAPHATPQHNSPPFTSSPKLSDNFEKSFPGLRGALNSKSNF